MLIADKRNIHIFNDLPPKSAPLKLHCWSKNDDLGYHTVDVDKEFEWTFCSNFSPSTLYTCQLWWGSKDRAFEVFDEKTEGMKSDRSVYWVAKNDGGPLSNETLVNKVLRTLPERFSMTVTAIEEAKDTSSLRLDDLIAEDEVDDLIAEGETTEEDTATTDDPDTNSPVSREEGVEPSVTTSDSIHPTEDTEAELQPTYDHKKQFFIYCIMASPPRNPRPAAEDDVHNDAAPPEPADPFLAIIVHPVNLEAVPISYIEPGDELNPIDPENFEFVGPSSTAGRFPTRRSKRMNPFPDLNTAGPQRRRGENSPRRGGRGGRRGGRGGRTPVRPNPPRGLHLVDEETDDEETDDEEGDPTFAVPEAQALSSSSSESSSNDSPPPASTQGETSQPSMAAAASQHPVSEGVAAHVPEDAAAPRVSEIVPQKSAAEDAAPYQDEEMPDFSGMSSAEHVDIPTVDAQDFTTTEETPSAPHADPQETLAEATVQADASAPQAEEPEKSDDSWEEEDVVPPVASPEPAYIPDELEDSEDEDSSEEEEPDLDGKNLSTPFELTHSLAQITYHQSMVDMLQKALSDQKGGEKANHEVEAGTSHPLDPRGREQGVNEEGAKNEGEAQGAEESSGSSASDGGAAADTEETLDVLL
ncbi:PREDICTED: trinucleotide repeat-containing gene 18 protein-like [Erythranthe guttata]|uniref:trinucleotide repeat-containing gene 18 protein-like n=1 Tax=Erythranthe guttata TaxID=4155 RepID=UPI00064DED2B|nr:PREDICTED: trinucleotide repeat-containing gene 18 protein-like [Erythranthe guttata]|eukprot:XP_012837734.1 PREDICTED: trinucleotide repeat-containing gene 18 protein-like [Erythranthe guttata]